MTETKVTYVFNEHKGLKSMQQIMQKMWLKIRNKLFVSEEEDKIAVMKIRMIATSIVDPSGLKKEQLGINWIEQAIQTVMAAIMYELTKSDKCFIETEKIKKQLAQDNNVILTDWINSDNDIVRCLGDDLQHRNKDTLDQIFDIARSSVNGWDNTVFNAA